MKGEQQQTDTDTRVYSAVIEFRSGRAADRNCVEMCNERIAK